MRHVAERAPEARLKGDAQLSDIIVRQKQSVSDSPTWLYYVHTPILAAARREITRQALRLVPV